MVRSCKYICLLFVLSLAVSVIWPDFSRAAQAPQLELLGEIKAGLRVPTRIDVDNSGNLYVADARLQQILKFDKFGQELLLANGEQISGAGLAVSPAGDRIYAAAFDKAIVFDANGGLLGYLGKGTGEFLSAGFIDVDSQGYVYVADVGTTQIKVYGSSGTFFKTISGPFKSISSLAVATQFDSDVSNDELYITDSFVTAVSQPALYVYSATGGLLRTLSAKESFSSPVRIFGKPAFDHAGRYYLGDVEQNNLHVMGLSGSPSLIGTPLASQLANPGALLNPIDIAFDERTSRLFVLYGDSYIKIYGVDGGQNPVGINRAPEVPVPVAPIGGSEVVTSLPDLQFNNAVDPDAADELSYTIRVFDAADNLITSLTIAEQPSLTTVPLDVTLEENSLYRWQVQAFDGNAESAWSELQSFYVNAVQEAPTVPELLAPLAGADVRTEALLEWQSATDADPFDTVSYLLEVATSTDFSEIIYSEELVVTERQLVDWSALVEPGQLYYWQITAVDNHGLKTVSSADGSFLFQTSLLEVTANMPGTRVYLGGNYGYAGQFIGEVPLQLRDLPEGRYQLTLERAGFEPFFQPVDIKFDVPAVVYAELRPALRPGKLNFQPLKVAGKPVKNGSLVTPLIVDLDLDGVADLLLANADGNLQYHPGTLQKKGKSAGPKKARSINFAAQQQLSLPQLAGGTPILVDWNNDYLQDLLIGTADGSVWLLLNQGDFTFSEEPVWVAAVDSNAVPAVADIDADGDKDLLVGSGNGELVLFSNLGTDDEVQLAEPQLLVVFAEAATPSFADWNGDGQRELLIAAEGRIYHALYTAGALTEMNLIKTKGISVARLFALDLDEENGKELIVGTADGKLLLSHSKKNDDKYVADFYTAVEAKLQQLKDALTEEAPDLLPMLEPISAKIQKKNMARLVKRINTLIVELPDDTSAAKIASELVGIML